jgi:hypothetical protein
MFIILEFIRDEYIYIYIYIYSNLLVLVDSGINFEILYFWEKGKPKKIISA